jgi:hypothetical protein
MATRCSEINVSGHFLLVQTFPNQVLFEFLKKIVLIKFWLNNEKLKFCSKTLQFFQKKNLKNQEKAQDFGNIFFCNLGKIFTNVHTQIGILRQKLFPCVGFWDIDS